MIKHIFFPLLLLIWMFSSCQVGSRSTANDIFPSNVEDEGVQFLTPLVLGQTLNVEINNAIAPVLVDQLLFIEPCYSTTVQVNGVTASAADKDFTQYTKTECAQLKGVWYAGYVWYYVGQDYSDESANPGQGWIPLPALLKHSKYEFRDKLSTTLMEIRISPDGYPVRVLVEQ